MGGSGGASNLERAGERSSTEQIEERLSKIEEDLKKPKKDIWDRLDTVSGIISGLIIALIGFYATSIYDQRSKEAERQDRGRSITAIELQTVEKFFPHLASKDEVEKQAAIQIISTMANPELAAKIAQAFGGSGARAALTNITATGSPQTKASLNYALVDLFKEFGKSTGAIEVDNRVEPTGASQKTQGTFVVVTKDGFALTAAHLFERREGGSEPEIAVFIGSRSANKLKARLVSKTAELALIKLSPGDYAPVKLDFQSIETGASVTVMGYPVGQDLVVSTGIVSSNDGPNGRIFVSTMLGPGSSGSPIFNSRGEVTGLILGGVVNANSSIGLPIQLSRSLLMMAGLR
jgi:S1-C subfamily serine protease